MTNPEKADLEAAGATSSRPFAPAGVAVSPFAENSFADALDPEEAPGWLAIYEKTRFSAKAFFPPVIWVPKYVRSLRGKATEEDAASMGLLPYSLGGDVAAGMTVGIMLVPQCLAFATLAGLPVQAGLYSSFLPLVAYTMFGTIRQVQVGPTALISLLSGQALDGLGLGVDDPVARMAGAALLALISGIISVLLGSFRFGFIVDFMSHTVMTAFCSAAGITIMTSQMKSMLGITSSGRAKYWWKTVKFLLLHLDETHGPTVALGFTLLAMLLTLKYWKAAGSADKRKKHPIFRFMPKDKNSRVFKSLKTVADLSSLVCVTVGWLWGLAYRESGVNIGVVGDVDTDGFVFAVPAGGMLDSSIVVSAAVIAIVGFLETMAVGGKFAAQSRYNYEPNQELIALGMTNVASAFMSGYPVTGSFTRTAVNAQFGATSLIAGAVSSVLVFAAMYVLLPVIALLPLAALSPIIIQGAIGVISLSDFKTAFKSSPSEFVVMTATFVVSLTLTVKEGLLVGFILSVLKTMNDLANPNLAVCGMLPKDGSFRDVRNFPQAEQIPRAVVVRMDARLTFANTRKLKEFCLKCVQVRERDGDQIDFIVLDCKSINHVDLTGGEMLEELADTFKSRSQCLILANLKGPVGKCLEAAGVPHHLEKSGGHLCHDMPDAMKIITGADDGGKEAKANMKTLVKNVNDAKSEIAKNNNQSSPFKCSSGQLPPIKRKSNGIGESSVDSAGSGNETPKKNKSGSFPPLREQDASGEKPVVGEQDAPAQKPAATATLGSETREPVGEPQVAGHETI